MIALLLALALASDVPVEQVASQPDRSAPPAIVPPEPLDLADAAAHELWPGLVVHHLRVPGLRKAHVRVVFRRGALELDGKSNATFTALGLAWDQATQETSADRLVVLQDLHDLQIFSDSGLQTASVRCVAPLEGLERGLTLLREVIFQPAFRRKDIRQFRDRWTRWYLTEAPTRSDTIIDAVMVHVWYPKGHAYASGPDLVGWRDVRRSAVRERHARLLAESPVDVMVVGDLPWSELEPMLRSTLEGLGVPGEIPAPPQFDRPEQTRFIGVHLGQTQQATLSLRTAAPKFDDSDSHAMFALDWAIGGGFLSRLNRNLREERGLTYGISSEYSAHMGRGHWTVSTQVEADKLGLAITEIDRELDQVVEDGVTQQEINDASATRIARWNDTLASTNSASSVYGAMLRHRRTTQQMKQRLHRMATLEVDETKRVAESWISKEQPRLWVVVGDRAKLQPKLEELGWEVRWLPSELIVLGVAHLSN